MTDALTQMKLTPAVAAMGVLVTALSFSAWGLERGSATAVGAVLSVLNWMALRWLLGRLTANGRQNLERRTRISRSRREQAAATATATATATEPILQWREVPVSDAC